MLDSNSHLLNDKLFFKVLEDEVQAAQALSCIESPPEALDKIRIWAFAAIHYHCHLHHAHKYTKKVDSGVPGFTSSIGCQVLGLCHL